MLTKQTNLHYMHMDGTGCQTISVPMNQIVYLFMKEEFQRNSHFRHCTEVRRKGLTAEAQKKIPHIVMQKKKKI